MTKLSDLIALQSADLPVADVGGHFATDNIEAALSELASDVSTLEGQGTGSQTLGTLSQTMNATDEAIINLSQAHSVPVITGYKENIGTGLISNDWSVDANDPKWDLHNSAPASLLSLTSTTGVGTFTLGTGNWNATDVGKTIINQTGTGRAIITNSAPESFGAITYTGTGASKSVSVGFQPDLVWIKNRTNGSHHVLNDSVRGAALELRSSDTTTEIAGQLTSFDVTGFTVDPATAYNENGSEMVAWCWEAGGTAGPNTQGTITSQVSANVAKGFSIVSYTGTGANATVGHGLSQAPEMIITKSRTNPYSWLVYHASLGNTNSLFLELAGAATPEPTAWNSTTPTNSIFSLGSYNGTNSVGDNIAYCWHSVAGHSKIGSYTGTGAAGNIVTCGFKPAFIMVKRTDGVGNWAIQDSTRGGDWRLSANLTNEENINSDWEVEFTDTGFIRQDGSASVNASGSNYIFMAFAESTFTNKAQADITEDFPDTIDISSGGWELGCGNFLNDGKFRACDEDKSVAITNSAGQIDTTNFTDMNSMTVTDAPLGGDVNYAFSTDGKITWQIVSKGDYTIQKSCMLNTAGQQYLSKTLGTPTNNGIWTYSLWVKASNSSINSWLLTAYPNIDNQSTLHISSAGEGLRISNRLGGLPDKTNFESNAQLRDDSAWHNIVVSLDIVTGSTLRAWVDGVELTWGTQTGPDASVWQFNSAVPHQIGTVNSGGFSDIYIADVVLLDGTAVTDASDFGELNSYGQWIPKDLSNLDFSGNNSFYLKFDDASDIGKDSSGNTNNWTAEGGIWPPSISNNSFNDTPTENYCIANSLNSLGTPQTLSEGNLRILNPSASVWEIWGTVSSTVPFYFEVGILTTNNNLQIGVCDADAKQVFNGATPGIHTIDGQGQKYSTSGGYTAYTSALVAGNIIGIAADPTTGSIEFFINGVSQGVAYTSLASNCIPYFYNFNSDIQLNFGQKSFAYSPPTGFLPLTTGNIPQTIKNGREHFTPVLYTGTGSGQSISGISFQPDLVWIKNRTSINSHMLFDTVRGIDRVLYSNNTDGELTNSLYLPSIDVDGFTIGSAIDALSVDYVAWCWKAGGPAGPNTQGSITSQVSANIDAGFSIVSYTGTGVAGDTIGHGLSQAPEFLFIKQRDGLGHWTTYHKDLGATKFLRINEISAAGTATSKWNDTEPTSSVFSIGNSSSPNTNGSPVIAYCWHSVPGYSKIGSYTGNGSTDGPFVYCGFKPAFLLIKCTDATAAQFGSWGMLDLTRHPYNPTDHAKILWANESYAEGLRGNGTASGDYLAFDLLDNGFKFTGTSNCSEFNDPGLNYIFMAFAENPFFDEQAPTVSRDIVHDNTGTWEINTNPAVSGVTWTAAAQNDQFAAIQEAVTLPVNQMGSVAVNLVSDAEWPALGSTLDFAMAIDKTNATGVPEISNVSFNYDAIISQDGLTLGTDFDVTQESDTQLKVTANTSGNIHIKVRG